MSALYRGINVTSFHYSSVMEEPRVVVTEHGLKMTDVVDVFTDCILRARRYPGTCFIPQYLRRVPSVIRACEDVSPILVSSDSAEVLKGVFVWFRESLSP
jgi:hypothetical protein